MEGEVKPTEPTVIQKRSCIYMRMPAETVEDLLQRPPKEEELLAAHFRRRDATICLRSVVAARPWGPTRLGGAVAGWQPLRGVYPGPRRRDRRRNQGGEGDPFFKLKGALASGLSAQRRGRF